MGRIQAYVGSSPWFATSSGVRDGAFCLIGAFRPVLRALVTTVWGRGAVPSWSLARLGWIYVSPSSLGEGSEYVASRALACLGSVVVGSRLVRCCVGTMADYWEG
ncbi:ARM repeat superfamily protein [Striga asiatica]|uniref:ARM repeat superfamily protein n=1 Tax=Striga asiatica TaxID=4170 RepID=A0A5A7Q3C0_STRAF|nr:ARM repeat superfamily protein [Striga asiatica]